MLFYLNKKGYFHEVTSFRHVKIFYFVQIRPFVIFIGKLIFSLLNIHVFAVTSFPIGADGKKFHNSEIIIDIIIFPYFTENHIYLKDINGSYAERLFVVRGALDCN